MKYLVSAASVMAMSLAAGAAMADPAGCDDGEIVVKFSHVTNTDKHPKGIAAQLLMERVNAEMDGTMCMEVFPNSTLYTDEQVIEAMLRGDVQMAAPSLSLFESITKAYPPVRPAVHVQEHQRGRRLPGLRDRPGDARRRCSAAASRAWASGTTA